MPYYHVIINLKSGRMGAIEKNLVEKDLIKLIVKPHNDGKQFKCGDHVVSQDNISNIKITESEQTLFVHGYSVSRERNIAELWQLINLKKDVTSRYIKKRESRKSKKAYMNQQKLNNIIKKWLESKGFNAKITGKEHRFTVQVQDLFPIKGYYIPDVIGVKDSRVAIVETENKLNEIYEAIVKCLTWKVMATFVYIAYPEDKCKKFRILEKYGIGLLSVSENDVKEVVSLTENDKPKFSVTEIHPLDFGREQELAKKIRRVLDSIE